MILYFNHHLKPNFNFTYMKRSGLLTSGLIFITFALLSGCALFKSAPDEPEHTVVGKVAGQEITFGELRSSFYTSPAQEDADPEATRQEMIEFLDLYLVYRAKVEASREEGYFDSEDITEELRRYQMQSVFPYWLEMRFRDELLDELVERSKVEIAASHILISVAEDAAPSDTLRAYNRLMEAREAFLDPDDERSFNDLSQEYSTRQRGRSMGDDLGFISGGWAVKPFEDVVFSTEVGDVSKPFRTNFGYHLVYVYDKREAEPDRNYSHIFFRSRGADINPEAAKEKAQEAFNKLEEGQSWDDVTREFSEDPDTRERGGDIGWIQPQRYQPMFLENIQKLSEQGTYTEPFQSEYGVHIVRLDSIRTYTSEEMLREEKYERLRNLPRYRENRTYTLQNVRRAAGDSIYVSNYELYLAAQESQGTRNPSELEFSDQQLALPMYRIDNKTFTLNDYHDFVVAEVGERNPSYRHNLLDKFRDKKTETVIIDVTKREFPDFAELSERYHEGLAVFALTEDNVWNYAAQDTTRLRAIYEEDPDRYRYTTRYRYYRISADTDEKLEEAKAVINHGVPVEEIREAVTGLIVRTDLINSLGEFPFEMLEGVEEGGFTEVFDYRNRKNVLYLKEIKEPRTMTFEEAFMRVVADYQPVREEEWNASLKSRYNVEAFPDRLRALLNEIEL